jgi:hypothetical protein
MSSVDPTPRTVVGLFDHLAEAQAAVQELVANGYSRDAISLVANASADEYSRSFDQTGQFVRSESTAETMEGVESAAEGAGIGAVLGGLAGLLASMAMLPIPGIGPVLAGGQLLTVFMGAVTGGLVGGLVGGLEP